MRTTKIKTLSNMGASLQHTFREREAPNADPDRMKAMTRIQEVLAHVTKDRIYPPFTNSAERLVFGMEIERSLNNHADIEVGSDVRAGLIERLTDIEHGQMQGDKDSGPIH